MKWARTRRYFRSILVSPLLLSLILAAVLNLVPQFHEIYISSLDGEAWPRPGLVLGLLATGLLSATLFFGYLSSWVVMRQSGLGFGSGLVFTDPKQITDDRNIVAMRDVLAILCGAAPFAGLAAGFYHAGSLLELKLSTLDDAYRLIGIPGDTPADIRHLASQARGMPLVICLAGVGALVVIYIAGRTQISTPWRTGWQMLCDSVWPSRSLACSYPRYTFIHACTPLERRQRMRTRMPSVIKYAALGWLIGVPIAQYLGPEAFNGAFVAVGPLATLALSLTAFMVLLFWLGEWSRHLGVPVMLLTAIGVISIGSARYLAPPNQVMNASARAGERVAINRVSNGKSELATKFDKWLESRRDRAQYGRYPVFVIAAQGGGIYAAAAISEFMAKLHDVCPNFPQHVFAVSAVSGGALGSVVFNSVASGQQVTERCALGRRAVAPLLETVRQITQSDHLSATLASTTPDLLRNLGVLAWHEVAALARSDLQPISWPGRAEALECSLLLAYSRVADLSGTKASCKDRNGGGSLLVMPYPRSWTESSRLPALVLNATRAETGDRVAYAPFSLWQIGDRSLKAFADLYQNENETTLLQAAVTSARFPAVMPAKVLTLRASSSEKKGFEDVQWRNFVDGGYADSSGSTTALDIYNELRQVIASKSIGDNVDLRMVLLANARDAVVAEPRGDGLVHAISPIITLFAVRGQMAQRAVSRALDEVSRSRGGHCTQDPNEDPKLQCVLQIRFDQQNFSLPLGWMMARPTAHMLGRMIGSPDPLPSRTVQSTDEERPDPKLRAAAILRSNHATMLEIREILTRP